ncbi:MAG: DUF2628 domain-containing protein [Campylobacterota bacterium]
MVSTENSGQDYDNKMLEAFINKPEKTAWYKNAFSQYSVNGVAKMTWVWSWWAFFGGLFYLLYRKAYMPALILLVLIIASSFIPLGGLILWVLTGGLAPYFVYKTYLDRKAEIESAIQDEPKRIETMRAVGGYNDWAVWLAVLLHLFFWVFVFIMFSTLMPMLSQQ